MTAAEERATVVTYNVLSPKLCDAQQYPDCAAEALDEAARFAKTEQLVAGWMAAGHIICLQEVSRAWADQLTCTALSRGYTPVFADYGTPRDGYMGVMTLWHNGRYALQAANTGRLCELERVKPAVPPQRSYWRRAVDCVSAWMWTLPPAAEDPATLTCHVYNRVAATHFCTPTGRRLSVVNYHMPCKYHDQAFMAYHVRLLLQFAARCTTPYILAGDFNIRPGTAAHAALDAASPLGELASPGFTCWTHSPRSGVFRDQLDYIIPFGVRGSRWVGHTRPEAGPLPTLEHPSDHLPLVKEVVL